MTGNTDSRLQRIMSTYNIADYRFLPRYLPRNFSSAQDFFALLDNPPALLEHPHATRALGSYSSLVFIQRQVKKWLAKQASKRRLILLHFRLEISAIILGFLHQNTTCFHPTLILFTKNNSLVVVASIRSLVGLGFRLAPRPKICPLTLTITTYVPDSMIISSSFIDSFPPISFFSCSRFSPIPPPPLTLRL